MVVTLTGLPEPAEAGMTPCCHFHAGGGFWSFKVSKQRRRPGVPSVCGMGMLLHLPPHWQLLPCQDMLEHLKDNSNYQRIVFKIQKWVTQMCSFLVSFGLWGFPCFVTLSHSNSEWMTQNSERYNASAMQVLRLKAGNTRLSPVFCLVWVCACTCVFVCQCLCVCLVGNLFLVFHHSLSCVLVCLCISVCACV